MASRNSADPLLLTDAIDGGNAWPRRQGRSLTLQEPGDGPVDAIIEAIAAIPPHEAKLPLYQVMAVTEGTDAQAEVLVRLEQGDNLVTGRGADTDTMVASAKAYVSALNKFLLKRTRGPAAQRFT